MLSMRSALLLTTALLLALPAQAQEMDHSAHMNHSAPAQADTLPPQEEVDLSTEPVTPAPAATPAPANIDVPAPTTPTQLVPPLPSDESAIHVEEIPARPVAQPEPAANPHAGHGGGAHDSKPLTIDGLPVAAPDRRGNTPLEGEVKDGVREFRLTTAPIAWPITDDVTVAAYAYNGQVPGPLLRVTAGEKIRVILTNNLSEPTTIHWHGVDVPIEMDGVPGISQAPVEPGASFTYEFTVPNTPGTFWYHTHVNADKQMALGLYGAFIIQPRNRMAPAWDSEHTLMLGEWTVKNGGNLPAMPMEGMFPNYFTINGKAWDSTERFTARVGERVLFRLIGSGSFSHPIHMHGVPFRIIAVDGHPLPPEQQMVRDTITVNPGERYDIVWTPTRPGTWLLHCHINHHTMNDGKEVSGMGGMAIPIEVTQ